MHHGLLSSSKGRTLHYDVHVSIRLLYLRSQQDINFLWRLATKKRLCMASATAAILYVDLQKAV
jgi:hypothetical protein